MILLTIVKFLFICLKLIAILFAYCRVLVETYDFSFTADEIFFRNVFHGNAICFYLPSFPVFIFFLICFNGQFSDAQLLMP